MFRQFILVVTILIVGTVTAGRASNADCTLKNLPNLQYGSTSCRLNDDAKAHLAKIAQMYRDSAKSGASCKIVIIGHPVAGDESQEKVTCRLGVIQRHLMNTEGLDPQSLITESNGTAKDENLFEFKAR
ncbi:MAG: hypothetical protein JNM09_24350 [Blastocatellia bacterium]|nr:hypothetical protein [Blastocatellia bacterium]